MTLALGSHDPGHFYLDDSLYFDDPNCDYDDHHHYDYCCQEYYDEEEEDPNGNPATLIQLEDDDDEMPPLPAPLSCPVTTMTTTTVPGTVVSSQAQVSRKKKKRKKRNRSSPGKAVIAVSQQPRAAPRVREPTEKSVQESSTYSFLSILTSPFPPQMCLSHSQSRGIALPRTGRELYEKKKVVKYFLS